MPNITLPFGVNVNGLSFLDSQGFTWTADQLWSAGANDFGWAGGYSNFSIGTAVVNTVDDTLYFSCKYNAGDGYWYAKVPNGNYNVYLGLQSYEKSGINQRVVDLYVGEQGNSVLVADNFDVYTEAGNTSYGACGGLRSTQQASQPYSATVTNGVLEVKVKNVSGLWVLNNIYIEAVPPTITSLDVTSGSTAGGTAVTITGTDFVSGATITFGGDAASSVNFVDSTSITCVTPAHAAGAVDVVVTNPDTQSDTLTDGFTYISPAPTGITIYKPVNPYTLYINDYNITEFQIERFNQSQEMNIITDYNIFFDEVEINIPIEADKLISYNIDNVLSVKKNGDYIYKGNINGKKLNFANKIVSLSSAPFIQDMAKTYTEYDQTTAKNIVIQINDILNNNLPDVYSIFKFIGLKQLLAGHEIYIDTDGDVENNMSLLNDLIELYDISVYFNNLEINLFIVGDFPNTELDISDYLKKQPEITERPDLLYNKITVKYKNSSGAAEETVTSGSGSKELSITVPSVVYMTDAAAQLLADRKLSIKNKLYYEVSIDIDKSVDIQLGEPFKYDDYTFIVTGKTDATDMITLKGIGRKL